MHECCNTPKFFAVISEKTFCSVTVECKSLYLPWDLSEKKGKSTTCLQFVYEKSRIPRSSKICFDQPPSNSNVDW